MHRWAVTTILGCTFAGAAALPSHAEPLQDSRGTYTFQIENDAVSTQKGTSDQYYTNGLRLGYTSPTGAVPDALARAGHAIWGDGVQRISIDLSQSIFTPRDTQISPPNPRDRPYAGYLNLTGALIQDTDTSRSTLALSLGIIGPSALGRQVQNGYHDIVGDTENRGWHNQLQNEPAVQILSERIWRLPLRQFGRFETDALPSATVGVGTVRDYVQGGVSFRFGQGLGSDFGTPRIRPGISGSDAYAQTLPFAWYVFAGADGQAIARDVFLDGSTFRDNSPHVSKKWYLGEFEAGVGIIYRGVRIAYTHTWQTESFNGQKGGLFNFGSLAVSAKF
jgi:lipid A 3-O-deacylase